MEQALSEQSLSVSVRPQKLLVNDISRHVAPLMDGLTEAVGRVLTSGWFILGQEVRGFETEFAAYLEVPHCVSVASGSDALELALRAVGCEPGHRVLTVANAGGYSSLAIAAIGAVPVYVDVDPESLLIDPAAVEEHLRGCRPEDVPRALVVTHLYGQVADVHSLRDVTQRFGVALVEDCAQAHGASFDGRRCGGLGDVAAFSFYPTKNLGALGDGGAITTHSAAIADRVRALRQYGWSTKYTASTPGGRNSRLDEMQAAVLRTMLPRLDAWNDRRRAISARYRGLLMGHPKLSVVGSGGDGDVSHLFVVRSPERDDLQEFLAGRWISTEAHYPVPDHRQPALQARLTDAAQRRLPVTELACHEVLSLPCFPELQDAEVDRVAKAVVEW